MCLEITFFKGFFYLFIHFRERECTCSRKSRSVGEGPRQTEKQTLPKQGAPRWAQGSIPGLGHDPARRQMLNQLNYSDAPAKTLIPCHFLIANGQKNVG